ncbi:MAG: hypothetical protein ABIF87_08400 [Pseudomonadota bacterium]
MHKDRGKNPSKAYIGYVVECGAYSSGGGNLTSMIELFDSDQEQKKKEIRRAGKNIRKAMANGKSKLKEKENQLLANIKASISAMRIGIDLT